MEMARAVNTASDSPYQFTGRENDGTGLYEYRNRYYSPQWGRFIAEDPLGFGGGDTNMYQYVQGNPISFTDPLGLCTQPTHIPNGCSLLPGFAQFQAAASEAFSSNPPNDDIIPQSRGINVHSAFSAFVSALPFTSVNVSYLNGEQTGYQNLGSSTPDAVYGNVAQPNFVIEVKSGAAELPKAQLDNYVKNLPRGTPICVISEIQ